MEKLLIDRVSFLLLHFLPNIGIFFQSIISDTHFLNVNFDFNAGQVYVVKGKCYNCFWLA